MPHPIAKYNAKPCWNSWRFHAFSCQTWSRASTNQCQTAKYIYIITNYLLGVCCILSRESASGRFAICRRSRRSTSNSGDLAAACHDLGALVFARLGCVCVCDLLILTVDHVDVYLKKELVKISKMFGTKHITPNDPPSSLLNVSLCKGQAFNCRTARSFQAPRGR